jgi:hypothetical protein
MFFNFFPLAHPYAVRAKPTPEALAIAEQMIRDRQRHLIRSGKVPMIGAVSLPSMLTVIRPARA